MEISDDQISASIGYYGQLDEEPCFSVWVHGPEGHQEYDTRQEYDTIAAALDVYGSQGWELVSVISDESSHTTRA